MIQARLLLRKTSYSFLITAQIAASHVQVHCGIKFTSGHLHVSLTRAEESKGLSPNGLSKARLIQLNYIKVLVGVKKGENKKEIIYKIQFKWHLIGLIASMLFFHFLQFQF